MANPIVTSSPRTRIMAKTTPLSKTPLRRWLTGTLSVLIILYAITGFWIIPAMAPGIIQDRLSQTLGTEVALDSIHLNPFLFSASLHHLTVYDDQGQPLLDVSEATLDLQAISLLTLQPRIETISLQDPDIRLVRYTADRFNVTPILEHLATAAQAKPKEPDQPSSPLRFYLGNLSISDGQMVFEDRHIDETFRLDNIMVQTEPVSNLKEWLGQQTRFAFMANLNGLPLHATVSGQPFAAKPDLQARLIILRHDLLPGAQYLPAELPVKLGRGTLTTQLHAHYQHLASGASLVISGAMLLEDLALHSTLDESQASLQAVTIELAESDLLIPQLHLRSLAIASPVIRLHTPQPAGQKTAAAPTASPLDRLRDQSLAKQLRQFLDDLAPAELMLDSLSASNGKLTIIDHSQSPAFTHTFRQLSLAGNRLGNGYRQPAEVTLEMQSDKIGHLQLDLKADLDKLTALAGFRAEEIQLTRFAPYYEEALPVTLERGVLSLSAALEVDLQQPHLRLQHGEVKLRNLALLNPATDERFIDLGNLDLVDIAIDALAAEATIANLLIADADLSASRLSSGQISLMLPFKQQPAEVSRSASTTPASSANTIQRPLPYQVTLEKLGVTNTRLKLTDEAVQPAFQTELQDITITGANLTTAAGQQARLQIGFTTQAAEAVHLAADLQLYPIHATGTLTVADLALPRYAPYLQNLTTAQLASGTLGIEASYTYAGLDHASTGIREGRLVLRDLNLLGPAADEPLLQFNGLELANISATPANRHLAIGNIRLLDTTLHLRRRATGELNLQQLLVATPQTENSSSDDTSAVPSSPTPPAAPWLLDVGRVQVSDTQLAWHDDSTAHSTTIPISDIQLDLQNAVIGPDAPPAQLDLQLSIADGTVALRGPIHLTPLQTELRLDVRQVNGSILQPYVQQVAMATVANAIAGTQGTLTIHTGDQLDLTYQGDAAIADLQLRSADSQDELITWRELDLQRINFALSPLKLHLAAVHLHDPKVHAILREDGVINFAKLMRQDDASPPEAAEPPPANSRTATASSPAPAPQIAIAEVHVHNGNFRFLDQSVSPPFQATLDEFQGTITGLSSATGEVAGVQMLGNAFGQAPFRLRGQLNPLGDQPYADLNIELQTAGLSPFDPYTSKYIGYRIQKGQLSLQLDIKLQEQLLNIENQVLLDQFELGESVPSDQAIQAPVKLAISILRDRDGKINLNVPVRGRMDDPEFKIKNTVIQAIVSLISKAALSPFKVLGNVINTGKDLQVIDFEPGATHPPNGDDKLQLLADALSQRPALKMDIRGEVNPQADREALRQQALQDRLRRAKFTQLQQAGSAPNSPDDVTMTPEEEPALMHQLLPDLPTDLPPAELRQRLLDTIEITDDDLKALAFQRAKNVQQFLLQKVQTNRLFLEQATLHDDDKARVVFELR